MRVAAPPARAQATAWFAPLPPGNVANSRPSTVSPGAGTCAARTTKSRLAEPATKMPLREDAWLMRSGREFQEDGPILCRMRQWVREKEAAAAGWRGRGGGTTQRVRKALRCMAGETLRT